MGPTLLPSFGSYSFGAVWWLGPRIDYAASHSFVASSVDDLPDAIQHLSC